MSFQHPPSAPAKPAFPFIDYIKNLFCKQTSEVQSGHGACLKLHGPSGIEELGACPMPELWTTLIGVTLMSHTDTTDSLVMKAWEVLSTIISNRHFPPGLAGSFNELMGDR